MPLLLKDDELKQLDVLVGEVPTKFGVPIINFFQLISQKRAVEAKAETDALGKVLKTKLNDEESSPNSNLNGESKAKSK